MKNGLLTLGALTVLLASLFGCQVAETPKPNAAGPGTGVETAKVDDQPQDTTLWGSYDAWTYTSATGWIKVSGNQLVLATDKISMAGTTLFPASGLTSQKLGVKDNQIWLVGLVSGTVQKVYLYDYFSQDATTYGTKILWLKTDPNASASLTAAPDPATALQSQILCYVPVGQTPSMTNNVTLVNAPTFTPAGGTQNGSVSVTLATSTSGATIRYTIDGNDPTSTTGTVYSTPINLTATTTIKAVAYKTGMATSSVVSATYTIPSIAALYTKDTSFLSSYLQTLAISSTGTIYTSAYGGSLKAIDTAGNVTATVTPTASMTGLNDLAIDKNGNLYTFDGWYFVSNMLPSGKAIREFGGARTSGQTALIKVGISLVVDASFNIFVADSNSNNIYKISNDGTLLKTFGGVGVANGKLNLTTNGKSLALDALGNLFVLDGGNSRIQKFDNNGNFLAVIPVTGSVNQILIDSADVLHTFDGSKLQSLDLTGNVLSSYTTDKSGRAVFDPAGNLYIGSGSVLYKYNRTTPLTVPNAAAIALSPSTVTLTVGDPATTIALQTSPVNAGPVVTWTTSVPGVATVSTTGVVTPVSAGTTTITASTATGLSATSTVTVTAIPLPTFSPLGGVQADSPVTVTLTSPLAGATLRYTTNGTEPTTTTGNTYSSGITLYNTTTIKAIAINNGVSSAVASATFTIPSSASFYPSVTTPSERGVYITPSSATIARSSPIRTFTNYGYSGTAKSYQWYLDGVAIAGATASVLDLDVTNPAVSGGKHQLTLVIQDASGVSYSGFIPLTVTN